MPSENLLIYLVAGAAVVMKLVADVLQRWRENRLEQQVRREPIAPDSGAQRWDALHDAVPGVARIEARPPRSVAVPRTLDEGAVLAATPSEVWDAARRRVPVRVEAAVRDRLQLRKRAELRRAMVLMAIVGPPRSRVPIDP